MKNCKLQHLQICKLPVASPALPAAVCCCWPAAGVAANVDGRRRDRAAGSAAIVGPVPRRAAHLRDRQSQSPGRVRLGRRRFSRSSQRLDPQNQPKPDRPASASIRLLAAWPEPEMLRQIVDRLNQWIRTQQPPADWKLDPMVAALPKPLADLPQVKDLGRMEFSRFDGFALQEAVWLRDVGLWARGDALDDLERAKSLFDWTVRNIQLEADDPNRIPQFPWETLLFGRGTATERAWVFILLARQLGIDAAMLAMDEEPGDGGERRGLGTSVTASASRHRPKPEPRALAPGAWAC